MDDFTLDQINRDALETWDRAAEAGPPDDYYAVPAPYGRCDCGEPLDKYGEHDGGYGAWCG